MYRAVGTRIKECAVVQKGCSPFSTLGSGADLKPSINDEISRNMCVCVCVKLRFKKRAVGVPFTVVEFVLHNVRGF